MKLTNPKLENWNNTINDLDKGFEDGGVEGSNTRKC